MATERDAARALPMLSVDRRRLTLGDVVWVARQVEMAVGPLA